MWPAFWRQDFERESASTYVIPIMGVIPLVNALFVAHLSHRFDALLWALFVALVTPLVWLLSQNGVACLVQYIVVAIGKILFCFVMFILVAYLIVLAFYLVAKASLLVIGFSSFNFTATRAKEGDSLETARSGVWREVGCSLFAISKDFFL